MKLMCSKVFILGSYSPLVKMPMDNNSSPNLNASHSLTRFTLTKICGTIMPVVFFSSNKIVRGIANDTELDGIRLLELEKINLE